MNSYQLDKIDFELLNLLQLDGALTYKELAAKVNRSKTNIVERIKALKAEGIIDRYVALVNTQKIKSIFIAFPLVQLKSHGKSDVEDFNREMDLHDEVMECYHITGNFDFMLKIATTDMIAYNAFLRDRIAIHPQVGTIQSFLVLSQSKRLSAYKF